MTTLMLTTEQRLLFRKSPNFFAEWMLSDKNAKQQKIHKRMQQWWTLHPNSYIEQHRGIGKTVQAVLRASWDVGHDPTIRIKVLQQSNDEASKTGRLVRDIMESPRYRAVFPEIEPDPTCWNVTEMRVKHGSMQRDPTFDFKGIFGRAGGRWDCLIVDDICDLRNSVQHPAMRDQVKDALSTTWMPMFDATTGRQCTIRRIGTCYHVDDITAVWRSYHGDKGTLLRNPVIDYVSPWPEVWSANALREWREENGDIAYARAYELRPISSDVIVFPSEWLDASMYGSIPYEHSIHGQVIAALDFAFTEKKMKNDPDYSVCLIGWAARAGHLYILDLLRVRASFPDFLKQAIKLMERHQVKRAVAEANGPQMGLVQQANRDSPIPITPMERTTDKITRASEKQAFVKTGRFHLPYGNDGKCSRGLLPVYDEMTTFPAGGHDDTVDAAIDLMELSMRSKSNAPPVVNIGGPAKTIYG